MAINVLLSRICVSGTLYAIYAVIKPNRVRLVLPVSHLCETIVLTARRADVELRKLQSSVEQRAEALHRDLAERHTQFEVLPRAGSRRSGRAQELDHCLPFPCRALHPESFFDICMPYPRQSLHAQ